MAQNDLDAALQLLAERAQYITGASGAAIALRRGEHADMLCRASAGSNAPELGALLSMEYGLSGESVRTRQALRCDDTETDARVNREGCRHLGIASVVVMPIVSEQRVLGVFELFSGKPRAFDGRDLSALQRLGEMVETAVKHAEAAQNLPAVLEAAGGARKPSAGESGRVCAELNLRRSVRTWRPWLSKWLNRSWLNSPWLNSLWLNREILSSRNRRDGQKKEVGKGRAGPVAKKPLFWSAALQSPSGRRPRRGDRWPIPVPAELRNLQKCKACGFPVSQGRTFCVECEEKQWRGQRLPQPDADAPSLLPEPGDSCSREVHRSPGSNFGSRPGTALRRTRKLQRACRRACRRMLPEDVPGLDVRSILKFGCAVRIMVCGQ